MWSVIKFSLVNVIYLKIYVVIIYFVQLIYIKSGVENVPFPDKQTRILRRWLSCCLTSGHLFFLLVGVKIFGIFFFLVLECWSGEVRWSKSSRKPLKGTMYRVQQPI